MSLQLFYTGYDAPTFSPHGKCSHNNHVNSCSFLQWSSSKDEWACIMHSGLLNPTQEVHKAILVATTTDKGISSPLSFTHFSIQVSPNNISPPSTNIFSLCPDVDKQPADSLPRVAAFNVEKLLLKSSETSRGAIYDIHKSLVKEWGPESLGSLPEDCIQELLIEVMKVI